MTFIHRNDIQNLISSDTLSLTKSNIHSWCFHRHHHLIVGLFFFHSFSFVMLLNLLCRPSIRYHFFFRFFSFSLYNNNNYARILILFMLMIIPTSLWNTLTEFFESILL